MFGPSNTWDRLYEYTHRATRRRFYWKGDDLVADAASEGFMRALGKNWSGLSCVTDDERERNWNYAKKVARLEAADYFRQEQQHPEVAVSQLIPEGLTPEQEQDFMDALYGADQSVTSAETVEERDLHERASLVIEALIKDEREWGAWAKDFLAGLSAAEAARTQGVTRDAIAKRRQRGMNRIQPILREHGLVKENL